MLVVVVVGHPIRRVHDVPGLNVDWTAPPKLAKDKLLPTS